MKTYLLNVIASPVFWRGVVSFAMAAGIMLDPAQQAAILSAGLSVAGILHAWQTHSDSK